MRRRGLLQQASKNKPYVLSFLPHIKVKVPAFTVQEVLTTWSTPVRARRHTHTTKLYVTCLNDYFYLGTSRDSCISHFKRHSCSGSGLNHGFLLKETVSLAPFSSQSNMKFVVFFTTSIQLNNPLSLRGHTPSIHKQNLAEEDAPKYSTFTFMRIAHLFLFCASCFFDRFKFIKIPFSCIPLLLNCSGSLMKKSFESQNKQLQLWITSVHIL